MKNRKERFHNKRANKAFNINRNASIREKELKKALKRINIRMIEEPIKDSIELYMRTVNVDQTCDYEHFSNDKEFTIRIFLNNIRHNHCNYDYILNTMKNLSKEEVNGFKEKVNKMILRKYKDLI